MPGKTATTEGRIMNDTKRTRKFNTAWGVFYLPLDLIEELGDPKTLLFTVTVPESAGGEG